MPSAGGDVNKELVRVLLVDDQDLVRAGLRRILRRKDGFEIIAKCADGDQVEQAVADHRPDVVVMDLRMRRVDGITATHRLRSHQDTPPVLVLTTFNDDQMLSGALRAGASGFVLKESSAEDLARAVRTVAAGNALLGLAVTHGCYMPTARRCPSSHKPSHPSS